MTKKNQIIFIDGKIKALNTLFSEKNFGYLAIGYAESDNGFEDPKTSDTEIPNGFSELTRSDYERIKLQPSSDEPQIDTDTGKVLVKFEAILSENNIIESQQINQIAVVDNANANSADTTYYSATTFPSFTKTNETSITFVIGFRL